MRPPPMPTLLEILLQMTDCVVRTDNKGGNPTGKGKRTNRRDAYQKQKGSRRGPATRLRHEYNMEQL